MEKQFKYAVNTNGLREKEIPDIVQICSQAGVDGIEWGLSSLQEAPHEAKQMRALTEDAGLEIAGFINAGHLWKTDLIRPWSEALKSAGGTTLRVAHPWFGGDYEETLHQRESFTDLMKRIREGLEKLVPLGREYNMRYVLEMHSGSVVASAPCARQVMEGLDTRYVGIIYDPANGVLEGLVRPRAAVEILGEYLAYVHAKNLFFRYSGDYLKGPVKRFAWEHKLCSLEYGLVDYVEIFFALKAGGFQGWIALEEFFSGKEFIEEEIKQAVRFLKECDQAAPSGPQEPYTTFND